MNINRVDQGPDWGKKGEVPPTKKETSEKEEVSLREQALKSKDKGVAVQKVRVAPTDEMTAKTEKQILSKTQKMIQLVRQHPSKRMVENKDKELTPDPKFICDGKTFERLLPQFEWKIIQTAADFDTAIFLSGSKDDPIEVLESNQVILDDSVKFLREQAQDLVKEKSIELKDANKFKLEDAYKLLIGVLDNYDDISAFRHEHNKSFKPQNTFVLRTALLLAAQQDGVGLQSWLFYTKSGKPDFSKRWTFMNNWKNWVPEAQGAMAKFSETTFVKAKELTKENPDQKVILLKGGFGAGKTRWAGKLMGEQASGVVAPDVGKRVVRRAMPEIPHSLAHEQGSQIAYKIFDDLIQNEVGTAVYDSSLSSAGEVQDYLKKSQAAGKKVVIYDIARHDMARSLAVLKRDVGGDDPRIPPDFIIRSALNDKLNRAKCMEVILNAEVTDENADIAPEYRFVGADARGWNAEEVLLLTPNSVIEEHPEMKERLALEGIEIVENQEAIQLLAKIKKAEEHLAYLKNKRDHTASGKVGRAKKANLNTLISAQEADLKSRKSQYEKEIKIAYKIRLTMNKEQLANYFENQFERPAQDIMRELSPEENQSFSKVFGQRVLISDPQVSIHNEADLYKALSQEIREVLPEPAFKEAFAMIKPETRNKFFQSIQKEVPQLHAKIKKVEKHLAYLKNKRDHAGSGKAGRAKKANLNTLISAQEADLESLKRQYKERFPISYLNLPLKTALIIHQNLQGDPWNQAA